MTLMTFSLSPWWRFLLTPSLADIFSRRLVHHLVRHHTFVVHDLALGKTHWKIMVWVSGKTLGVIEKRSFRGNKLNLLTKVSHFSPGKKLSCNKLCAPFCYKRGFAVLRVIFAVREKNVRKFSAVTVSPQRLDNPLLPCIAIHLDIHLRYEWSVDIKESINFLEDNGFRIHVKWTSLKMERLYDIPFWGPLNMYIWWHSLRLQ